MLSKRINVSPPRGRPVRLCPRGPAFSAWQPSYPVWQTAARPDRGRWAGFPLGGFTQRRQAAEGAEREKERKDEHDRKPDCQDRFGHGLLHSQGFSQKGDSPRTFQTRPLEMCRSSQGDSPLFEKIPIHISARPICGLDSSSTSTPSSFATELPESSTDGRKTRMTTSSLFLRLRGFALRHETKSLFAARRRCPRKIAPSIPSNPNYLFLGSGRWPSRPLSDRGQRGRRFFREKSNYAYSCTAPCEQSIGAVFSAQTL